MVMTGTFLPYSVREGSQFKNSTRVHDKAVKSLLVWKSEKRRPPANAAHYQNMQSSPEKTLFPPCRRQF